jgi:hypothetical protein
MHKLIYLISGLKFFHIFSNQEKRFIIAVSYSQPCKNVLKFNWSYR